MTTIEISGHSDDCIEIDGDITEEWYQTNDEGDYLAFSDGTILRIAYDPDGSGNWRITPHARGTAELIVVQATADGDEYTDKATLTGDIKWVAHSTAVAHR